MNENEEATSELSTIQQNERVKLTATWLNGLSIATLAVGVIAQLFSILGSNGPTTRYQLAALLICVVVSPALHWWARRTLKGLRR